EYKADEGGGELCGNPNYLADALEKISMYSSRRTMQNATAATAHMFIMCPFSLKDMQKLFSTHPSTEERVKLLREQAEAMKRQGKLEE
ncbi:MAG: M48 family metalloprotease, partial [Acidaminococcaceae bacterium]|nr:M48 family metalloprotease [Acidaminococcaceae bacterium]